MKAARQFVTRIFGARAIGFSPLAAGEWSQAYAFELDGKPVVIRFGDYVEDFLKDRAMAAHATPSLPIPQVIEIGPADGGYFALSERAPGRVLNELDAAGMHAALPGLLRALDEIRDVDASGSRGYGLWSPDGHGPFPTWPEALLACNQETERIAGWRAALTSAIQR
jgi:hygromycin-B 4-O-kinase